MMCVSFLLYKFVCTKLQENFASELRCLVQISKGIAPTRKPITDWFATLIRPHIPSNDPDRIIPSSCF